VKVVDADEILPVDVRQPLLVTGLIRRFRTGSFLSSFLFEFSTSLLPVFEVTAIIDCAAATQVNLVGTRRNLGLREIGTNRVSHGTPLSGSRTV
jgi:hypothetical protein